ncbi:MAG TPA: restriction endonuclease subunit S, partial [Thermoanaerobaculia bacterium]|nr:restriction endonuclease subunit S [Thermoanaerobaculia bacterium]
MRTALLGEIVEFRGGGTPSKARPEFYAGNIPWVTPKDMKSWLVDTSAQKITAQAVVESAAKLIPSASVLVVV